MLKNVLLGLLLLASSALLTGQSGYSQFKEGKAYQEEGRRSKAIRSYEEALELAEQRRNTALQMKIHLELAELKNNLFNYKSSLEHYERFTALYKQKLAAEKAVLEDSVVNLETQVEEGADSIRKMDAEIVMLNWQNLKAENEKQLLEIENQNQQLAIQEHQNRRNILSFIIGIAALVILFVAYAWYRNQKTNKLLRKKNDLIAQEKEKSDELLLNILPASIAAELKESGKTSSKRYDNASIMFTDFKGFTKFSEHYTPEELVHELDTYFTAFDEVMQKYGIEKIKTIGDAYMCVAGVPDQSNSHALNIIYAAFELRDFVQQRVKELKLQKKPYLEVRIGIHTGSLVAGVVGSKKFAFDVWGDAVNVAARMEQSGAAGAINVSEKIYQLVKDDFELEYRGEIEAKNKGKMRMYFVQEAKNNTLQNLKSKMQ